MLCHRILLAQCIGALPHPQPQFGALHHAAMTGDIAEVRALLKSGRHNINERIPKEETWVYGYSQTALMFASQKGHADVVQLLLDEGADEHAADSNGSTALHYAIGGKDRRTVQTILGVYGNVDLHATVQPSRFNALHLAARVGDATTIPLLLRYGCPLTKTASGQTALGLALEHKHLQSAEVLLVPTLFSGIFDEETVEADKERAAAAGFDVDYGPGDYGSVFMAVYEGNFDAARLLLERGYSAMETAKDAFGLDGYSGGGNATSLFIAAQRGSYALVRALLAHGAAEHMNHQSDGLTPLMAAAKYGHIDVMKILLRGGAQVDFKESESGSTALAVASISSRPEVLQLLLEHGADINITLTGENHRTVLHLAAFHGNDRAIPLLMRSGAPLTDATTKFYPLNLAIGHKRWGAAALLIAPSLEAAVKVGDLSDIVADANKACADHAQARLNLQPLLEEWMDARYLPTWRDKVFLEKPAEDVQCGLSSSSSSDEEDEEDQSTTAAPVATTSLLYGAAVDGDLPLVNMLLPSMIRGAINGLHRTQYDDSWAVFRTPLMGAAMHNRVSVVRALLHAGASPNIADGNGTTPLALASVFGHAEVVGALLAGGADINARVGGTAAMWQHFARCVGWTALHYAALYGHVSVMQLLLDSGAQLSRDECGESAFGVALKYDPPSAAVLLHAAVKAHSAALPDLSPDFWRLHRMSQSGTGDLSALLPELRRIFYENRGQQPPAGMYYDGMGVDDFLNDAVFMPRPGQFGGDEDSSVWSLVFYLSALSVFLGLVSISVYLICLGICQKFLSRKQRRDAVAWLQATWRDIRWASTHPVCLTAFLQGTLQIMECRKFLPPLFTLGGFQFRILDVVNCAVAIFCLDFWARLSIFWMKAAWNSVTAAAFSVAAAAAAGTTAAASAAAERCTRVLVDAERQRRAAATPQAPPPIVPRQPMSRAERRAAAAAAAATSAATAAAATAAAAAAAAASNPPSPALAAPPPPVPAVEEAVSLPPLPTEAALPPSTSPRASAPRPYRPPLRPSTPAYEPQPAESASLLPPPPPPQPLLAVVDEGVALPILLEKEEEEEEEQCCVRLVAPRGAAFIPDCMHTPVLCAGCVSQLLARGERCPWCGIPSSQPQPAIRQAPMPPQPTAPRSYAAAAASSARWR